MLAPSYPTDQSTYLVYLKYWPSTSLILHTSIQSTVNCTYQCFQNIKHRTSPKKVKLHVFQEGHKNWQNLHHRFDVYYIMSNQIDGEDFVDFCGLLRKHKLYHRLRQPSYYLVVHSLYFWVMYVSNLFMQAITQC